MMQWALVLALALEVAAGSRNAASRDVGVFCELIDSQIPDRISYPESPAYNESISSYYSGQERDIQPGCIFRPKDEIEVSAFLKLVTADISGCSSLPHFAVRSGGHMIWPGSANIEHGITVDLRAMNSTNLNEDKTVLSLGPGGIWSEIYPQLEPYNLTVMGGRVPGIGVGGLATGGGIHFSARQNGWVCDNIYAYQVVLANGTIIEATASSHHDLWLALKGGSNNFGIVTRIDVPTWPLDMMWGGQVVFEYNQANLDAHARKFSAFMREENFDAAAHMGTTLVFDQGNWVIGDALYYTEPIENPAVYEGLRSIEPKIIEQVRVQKPSDLVNDSTGLLPPNTTRAIDIVYSYRSSDADVYSALFKAWEEGVKRLQDIAGLQIVLLTQPHPVTNGTNSLGLESGRKDEVVTVLTGAYTRPEDDEVVQAGMEAIVAAQKAILEDNGLLIPFQYLNYADIYQDPIGGYGDEVKARLQDVSRRYDPDGVFQKQVPGGFKVFP